MTKVLILDTETTGLDNRSHSIIEVAAISVDLRHKKIESQRAALIYAVTNLDSENLTGITQGMLDGVKNATDDPFDTIKLMAKYCDCIVAHNAEFDRGFVEAKGIILMGKNNLPLEWICSYRDLEYDLPTINKKLGTLAEAYGVNSGGAHRAMADVMMLASIFFKIENIDEQIKKVLSDRTKPLYKIISLAPFEKKEDVKKAGFRWDGGLKQWWKTVRAADEDELFNIISVLNFDVKITS